MDRDLAITQLRVLAAVPGALKIITNMLKPAFRADPDNWDSGPRVGVTAEDMTNPEVYLCHDVVGITGPDHRGRFMAVSAAYETPRGTVAPDRTIAQPEVLLDRLQHWRTEARPLAPHLAAMAEE